MDAVWQQLRRRDENSIRCWGYQFQLAPEHLTLEQSHPLKFSYDKLGEECLDRLNIISPPSNTPSRQSSQRASEKIDEKKNGDIANEKSKTPKRDLYLLLKENYQKDETLRQFWDEVNTVPEWVDWEQISRGQEVFYRYGGAAINGLAYQSLLGGMGANRVVETLARTGGFSTKVARSRLFETTQHILECTKSLESIKPGGAGQASSIRVRLLHAAVRQRIMKLVKVKPGYYDVDKWGIPINDLDCIATIGTFSATLIWLSFPRQGIILREQEIRDYIALWRLIAHYTGTPTEHFETPAKAKAIMESLLMNEIDPSETSKILANNVVACLEGQPPTYASRPFLEASARWLNGHELCDRLGLGHPSLYYYGLVAGQCIFFMFFCYVYRSIPYLDRRKISTLRRLLWAVIVEGKYGLGEKTVFDFKYIPDLHITTEKENAAKTGVAQNGVERRNLRTLVIALVATALLTYFLFSAFVGWVDR